MTTKPISLPAQQNEMISAGVKLMRVVGKLPVSEVAHPTPKSAALKATSADTNEAEVLRLALEVWESEGGALNQARQSPE